MPTLDYVDMVLIDDDGQRYEMHRRLTSVTIRGGETTWHFEGHDVINVCECCKRGTFVPADASGLEEALERGYLRRVETNINPQGSRNDP
jgi:hypothetical protein